MLEKGFLLLIAMVGGYASVSGTLPAVLVALFGVPGGVITTSYATSASEDTAITNEANQAALAQYAEEVGTAQGAALAQALGTSPPVTTATGQAQLV